MTIEISVLNHTLGFDDGVFVSRLGSELTLTNAKEQLCIVMPTPSGGGDLGFEVEFAIPLNYSSSPVLRLWGVIDGTPSGTFGVGAQLLERNISESVDAAYEAEDTASNATWTGYAAEEYYYIDITLTPGTAFTGGRRLLLRIYRDDNVDTDVFPFLLTDALFQYTES
jgi:hypothetical protein